MRLITFTHNGATRTGALTDDDGVVDLHAVNAAIPADMIELLADGEPGLERVRKAASGAATLALADVALQAPIPRPPKVLAIGLNYRDHAEESGQEIPKHPVVFTKMPTCITGPSMPIHRPKVSGALDWEGELCVVIGKRARGIAAADAMSIVAGYMNGNDVSVRDWQFHSPTWMMGKSFDTHGPTGPWLVTANAVDVTNLDVRTYVNGEQVQSSNTKHLIFDVPAIIAYLSAAFTLEPGDVIFTGTPAGVGVASKPPRFMQAGDVVRVEIAGLGVLENPVIDEP